MATNAIKINVVCINQTTLLPTATDYVVTSLGTYVVENTYGIDGANCTVIVPKGQNTNAYTNYQVTDTLDEVIAMLNEDTVADLSVVGSLSVGNDLSVTDDATIGGDLAVTGSVTTTAGLVADNIDELTPNAGTTINSVNITEGGVIYNKNTVTQATSKTTGVSVNRRAVTITTVALTDNAGTSFSFTLTNTSIVATSVIYTGVNMNGGTGCAVVTAVPGAGSAVLTVHNVGAAAFNSAIKIMVLIG